MSKRCEACSSGITDWHYSLVFHWYIVFPLVAKCIAEQLEMQAIIHAPNSLKLDLKNCPQLKSIHVWSDQLTQLSFDGCTGIESLVCRCDKLNDVSHPPLVEVVDRSQRPNHKPIQDIVLDAKAQLTLQEAAKNEAMVNTDANPSFIPAVYRAPVPGQ